MIILFSTHSLQRMRERTITKEVVERVLADPDKKTESENQIIAAKRTNGKVTLVIYSKFGEVIFVITVVVSSKLRKYLK